MSYAVLVTIIVCAAWLVFLHSKLRSALVRAIGDREFPHLDVAISYSEALLRLHWREMLWELRWRIAQIVMTLVLALSVVVFVAWFRWNWFVIVVVVLAEVSLFVWLRTICELVFRNASRLDPTESRELGGARSDTDDHRK